jgi:hypothetical protein
VADRHVFPAKSHLQNRSRKIAPAKPQPQNRTCKTSVKWNSLTISEIMKEHPKI